MEIKAVMIIDGKQIELIQKPERTVQQITGESIRELAELNLKMIKHLSEKNMSDINFGKLNELRNCAQELFHLVR